LDKRDLLEYLESAVTLEREIHTLEQLRKELEKERAEFRPDPPPPRYPNRPEAKKIPPPPSEQGSYLDRYISENRNALIKSVVPFEASSVVLIAGLMLIFEKPLFPMGFLLLLSTTALTMMGLLIYALINAQKQQEHFFQHAVRAHGDEVRRIQSENSRAVQEYERKCDEIKREYEQTFRETQEYNDNVEISNAAIDESQETIDRELQKLNETLTGVYGLDIVFPKYHNIVAFSSFCEYLQSGRCDTLEGTHGAYNIFEREVRSDAMVSQLKNLDAGLAQIGKNQYKLYTEITAANNHARALAENVREKMNLFSAGQSRMSGELAAARRDSSRLADKVSGLDSHMKRLSEQSARMNSNLASLKSKLGGS
jgi:hypothetical protein